MPVLAAVRSALRTLPPRQDDPPGWAEQKTARTACLRRLPPPRRPRSLEASTESPPPRSVSRICSKRLEQRRCSSTVVQARDPPTGYYLVSEKQSVVSERAAAGRVASPVLV